MNKEEKKEIIKTFIQHIKNCGYKVKLTLFKCDRAENNCYDVKILKNNNDNNLTIRINPENKTYSVVAYNDSDMNGDIHSINRDYFIYLSVLINTMLKD